MRGLGLSLILLLLTLLAQAQVLERGNGPEPDSLDPHRAQSLSAHSISRDLFEGLTREGANGEIVPALAQSWEVSADGLRWRFYLRPNLRFSDGSPINASVFVRSFARALQAETAAPYGGQLLVIKGASERLRGQGAEFGVRAIEANVVEIELTQITPNLLARLSLPVAALVQSENVAKHGQLWTRPENIVCSGAYCLKQWRPLAFIRLQANPHYFEADQVRIPAVRYHVTEDASAEARRFEAGELHLTETIPPGRLAHLRARFGARLQIAPSLGTFFLGLNLTQPPFKANLPLRQALNLAIDRTRIVELITGTGELPAYGLLPPALGSAMADGSPDRAANETAARALYAQAGYSVQKPLVVELRYNTSVLNRRLMLAVSVMWEQVLGVQTILRQEEMKVLVQNRKARRITQAFRGGWNADLADPLDFLDIFAEGSPLNTTGFRSAKFTQLLQQLHQSTEPVMSAQLARAAHQELMAAQPIIPLFHYTSKHLVSPKLRGYVANPLDHHPSRYLYWADAP